MSEIQTSYRGTLLRIEIRDGIATLSINGLQRDEKMLASAPQTLRLSSTVQTDYEWHEFIEAILNVNSNHIHVSLLANNLLLTEETLARS